MEAAHETRYRNAEHFILPMRLYLLRHGDAVESPYYHDSQRPLSDPGRRQIRTVARYLQSSRTKVDLMLSSPLVRARETAEIIRAASGIDILTTETLVPGSNHRELVSDVNRHEVNALLLVGHEPQLSGFTSFLTGGDEHFRVQIRKGSLVCLESQFPLKRGEALLLWLLTLQQMELIR